MKEYYIIIDIVKCSALYGVRNATLTFSTAEIAFEVAKQFFTNRNEYIITYIQI